MKNLIIPITVDNATLYIYPEEGRDRFWIVWRELSDIFKIESGLLENLKDELKEGVHWRKNIFKSCGVESETLQISKRGVYQIAYRLDQSRGSELIDTLEDIQIECSDSSEDLFDEVENILKERLDSASKSSSSLSEVDEILTLLSSLLMRKEELSRSKDSSLKGFFYQFLDESLRKRE